MNELGVLVVGDPLHEAIHASVPGTFKITEYYFLDFGVQQGFFAYSSIPSIDRFALTREEMTTAPSSLFLFELIAHIVRDRVFRFQRQASRIYNLDCLRGFPPKGSSRFDFGNNIDPVQNHPKGLVDPVEPLCLACIDKPL